MSYVQVVFSSQAVGEMLNANQKLAMLFTCVASVAFLPVLKPILVQCHPLLSVIGVLVCLFVCLFVCLRIRFISSVDILFCTTVNVPGALWIHLHTDAFSSAISHDIVTNAICTRARCKKDCSFSLLFTPLSRRALRHVDCWACWYITPKFISALQLAYRFDRFWTMYLRQTASVV
jgi:hypothetical protein